jgi:hypothetical protein
MTEKKFEKLIDKIEKRKIDFFKKKNFRSLDLYTLNRIQCIIVMRLLNKQMIDSTKTIKRGGF